MVEFEKILKAFKKDEKICFVCHSLSCVFTLHLLEKYGLKLDCAIFVAPFLEKLHHVWEIDLVNDSFYKTDFDFRKLQKQITDSYGLYSDNDPYVDQKYALDFINKMKSQKILVRGAKHMSASAGFTKFPLVLELCKTRIS